MDLASSTVTAIMREEFPVLRPEDPVDSVDPIASELVSTRHLVVLDPKRRVIGILSLRDLLEVSLARLRLPDPHRAGAPPRPIMVSDLMSRPVETIGPGEMLAAAANRMISHRVGCLPVVREDGAMIGLVTDADLLQAAYRGPLPRDSASSSGSSSSSRK